ncbi:chromobox protein homolog 1 [Tetranychus urticae]|uniref:Chromo domain-containing protein n=1 Tax=Tetranychus urticae TaxID=32264 RepID=T1KRR7_TETUR|nr:chromobox protein homolog 1 [Tetranychus urticae]
MSNRRKVLKDCLQYGFYKQKRIKKVKTSSKVKATTKKQTDKFYSVEEILGRRVFEGKVEYLLKWQGYPDSYNSWEDTSNITSDLLYEFELSTSQFENMSKEAKSPIVLKDVPVKIWDIRKDASDDLEYLVQWKKESELEWVSAVIMREGYPQLVIEFYERISSLVD